MGVVGPEGLSKHKGFNAVRCLTLPSVRLRHKGLRADCLTFAAVSDYPLSPASTRRRIASGLLGLSGWVVIQSPIFSSSAGGTRSVYGVELTTGRPGFLALSIDLGGMG